MPVLGRGRSRGASSRGAADPGSGAERRYADRVDIVDQFYYWTELIIFWSLVALRVWALADCLSRRAAAFPAVDKLTKPAWGGILAVSGALGTLLGFPTSTYNTVSVFSLISAGVAAVYLADVRPAVRDITSGR